MMPPCVTILNKGPTKKQLAHRYVYTIKVVKKKKHEDHYLFFKNCMVLYFYNLEYASPKDNSH